MIITATTPENGATNLALKTVVTITFDEEVDIDGAKLNGGIVVATSASKVVNRGPGFEEFYPSNEEVFSSKIFTGLVKGRLSTDDNLTVTFTPRMELEPNKLYRVLIGEGLTTRTVGDVEADEDNTGTGNLVAKGPYTGGDESYTINVTVGGALGVARFTYTRVGANITSAPQTTDRKIKLESGLELRFVAGNYQVGDAWSFDVFEPETLEEVAEFSFTTGSASYQEVPVETPSVQILQSELNGINRIDGVHSNGSNSFAVLEVSPETRESNVRLGRTIVITFSKALDPDRIDEAVIEILMKSLPIDTTLSNSTELLVSRRVDGNQLILTFIG